jgi:hypothetical protein
MDPMEHCLSPYQPQPSESSKEVLERLLENHDPVSVPLVLKEKLNIPTN